MSDNRQPQHEVLGLSLTAVAMRPCDCGSARKSGFL
jgi:hypothetical protein